MMYRSFPKIPDLKVSTLGLGMMRLPVLDGLGDVLHLLRSLTRAQDLANKPVREDQSNDGDPEDDPQADVFKIPKDCGDWPAFGRHRPIHDYPFR